MTSVRRRGQHRLVKSNSCRDCDWTPLNMSLKSQHVKGGREDEERTYFAKSQMDSGQRAVSGMILTSEFYFKWKKITSIAVWLFIYSLQVEGSLMPIATMAMKAKATAKLTETGEKTLTCRVQMQRMQWLILCN